MKRKNIVVKQKQKGGKYKNHILLGICSFLTIFSIFMTIETASVGNTMSKEEQNEAILLSRKHDLEEMAVKGISLSELETKASTLGFSKATNLLYISNVSSVANLP